MKRFISVAVVVAALVGMATAGGAFRPGEKGPEPSRHPVIGVQKQEIADSSPVVTGTIRALDGADARFAVGSAIKIRITIENVSEHPIDFSMDVRNHSYYRGGIVYVDVRDAEGKLAPETEVGCMLHFFSPCHNAVYAGMSDVPISLAPGKKLAYDPLLGSEYRLSPGSYTVVGYVCGMSEGPECIKTNTIPITVH